MTEDRFTELVNLFLDNEIDPADLSELERAISADAARRDQFNERCQLDRAMRMAMGAAPVAGPDVTPAGRRRSVTMPIYLIGGAMAATFVLGMFLMPLVENFFGMPTADEVRSAATDADSFDDFRYEVVQRARDSEMPNGASLAAHLRLAGMHPGVVPPDAELRRVPVRREIRTVDGRPMPVLVIPEQVIQLPEMTIESLFGTPRPHTIVEPIVLDRGSLDPALVRAASLEAGSGGR